MVKIFVGNIPSDCARADVIDIFDKYGKVKDCDIIRNFAFIHMENDDDAREAIDGLNGTRFMGGEITVEESTSRPRNTQKLYIGNLSSSASRRELEKMFEKYGEVVSCDIIKDFAFVHMSKDREAEKAIREMNGITYAGRKINVEFARNDRDRRNNRFGGYDRGYGQYNDRWNNYNNYGRGGGFGRGGYRGGGGYYNDYRRSNYGGGGGGGRYNSYNRYRSPPRRHATRSRSPSRSRSRSQSPPPRNDQSRSRSKSQTPDRRSVSSKSD